MSTPGTFRQARWNEPIVIELGRPGQRGVVPPPVDPAIAEAIGDPAALVPEGMRRERPPRLPELSQPETRRHFLRLSQETMGAAIGIDVGQGTATLKYSPPINDQLVRPLAGLHPLQPPETVQGTLEVLHRFEGVLRELSGLDRFSFQPGGGTHGIYANACIMRAYHARRGEAGQRDEIITTLFSHPSDAAAPATAGFKVVTLYPGRNGYPELDALRAALSERTAGLVVANPEDTGIFNPEIDRMVALVHEAGGLCAYDQANANGILGITRAGDAGFDLCQFNLHKTFSSPHGSGGLACGAIGVRAELEAYLPVPVVVLDDVSRSFALEWDRPDSIGAVRAFHGVVSAVVRSYAWVATLGPDGVREAARIAVLNNNYLARRLSEIPGITVSYAENAGQPRLEQIRYSLSGLADETGVGTEDVARRTVDHGFSAYFPSHHPWVVPEPATLEPTESISKAEIDAYVEAILRTAEEARRDPDIVRNAPASSAIHRIDGAALSDPARWALTWRAYLRKQLGQSDRGASKPEPTAVTTSEES